MQTESTTEYFGKTHMLPRFFCKGCFRVIEYVARILQSDGIRPRIDHRSEIKIWGKQTNYPSVITGDRDWD